MSKLFSGALLSAAAAAALLVPAAPAHAQSQACAAAIDAINAAVDASPNGTFDANTIQDLHGKLQSIDAAGAEKEVILAYADALVDDSVTNLDPATDELNRVCNL
ncbi:hypothetical protein F5X71_25300 [Nocardia brasiliensis]|uniref:Haemophore haem-binding domain-containing protein n=1 Tax=Nocardia brasiliensis TaxID=37326 RepID=A0A6G9XWE3_NOCBR|nr:hypothetical protein [Nocardia brasiliensis]QIS05187.1 hypothetical protein F5X71_25300 [Nocardia brasiliensis]